VDVQARDIPLPGIHCFRWLEFVDSAREGTLLYQLGSETSFELEESIPANASTGVGMFIVLLIGIRQGSHCQPGFNEQVASARFTVTGLTS
jgi:hypothetical protein